MRKVVGAPKGGLWSPGMPYPRAHRLVDRSSHYHPPPIATYLSGETSEHGNDASELAKEVLSLVEERAGSSAFVPALAAIQRKATEKRETRKRSRYERARLLSRVEGLGVGKGGVLNGW